MYYNTLERSDNSGAKNIESGANIQNEFTPLLEPRSTRSTSDPSCCERWICRYYFYFIYFVGWTSLFISHMGLILSRNMNLSGSFDIIGGCCIFLYSTHNHDIIITIFTILWIAMGILEIKKSKEIDMMLNCTEYDL